MKKLLLTGAALAGLSLNAQEAAKEVAKTETKKVVEVTKDKAMTGAAKATLQGKGKTEAAKEAAKEGAKAAKEQVKASAKEKGQKVAGAAKEQAKEVAGAAKDKAVAGATKATLQGKGKGEAVKEAAKEGTAGAKDKAKDATKKLGDAIK